MTVFAASVPLTSHHFCGAGTNDTQPAGARLMALTIKSKKSLRRSRMAEFGAQSVQNLTTMLSSLGLTKRLSFAQGVASGERARAPAGLLPQAMISIVHAGTQSRASNQAINTL